MSYIAVNDLAESASFKTRVKVAIVKAAGYLIHEDATGFTPARRDKRYNLARAVLSDPNGMAAQFVWPVVANTTIAAEGLDAPDSDLDYQVSAIWDAMAGVTAAELA